MFFLIKPKFLTPRHPAPKKCGKWWFWGQGGETSNDVSIFETVFSESARSPEPFFTFDLGFERSAFVAPNCPKTAVVSPNKHRLTLGLLSIMPRMAPRWFWVGLCSPSLPRGPRPLPWSQYPLASPWGRWCLEKVPVHSPNQNTPHSSPNCGHAKLGRRPIRLHWHRHTLYANPVARCHRCFFHHLPATHHCLQSFCPIWPRAQPPRLQHPSHLRSTQRRDRLCNKTPGG